MMATATGFIVECTAGVPTGHAGSARTRGRDRAPVGPWRRPFWATRGPAARDRLSSRRTDPQVPMRHALTPSRIVGRRGIRGALVYGEAHRRVDTSMGFSVVRGDGLQSETPRKRARRTGLECTASCRATPHNEIPAARSSCAPIGSTRYVAGRPTCRPCASARRISAITDPGSGPARTPRARSGGGTSAGRQAWSQNGSSRKRRAGRAQTYRVVSAQPPKSFLSDSRKPPTRGPCSSPEDTRWYSSRSSRCLPVSFRGTSTTTL